MSDCVFCKIISGEIPSEKIYEDEHTFAFLDITPLNDGHTLVVPKIHYDDMLSTPKEIFHLVMETVYKLAPIIKEATGADGINLGNNNGGAAGQVIFHLHAHIIPRYTNDGYHSWSRTHTESPKLKETQQKIIAVLDSTH